MVVVTDVGKTVQANLPMPLCFLTVHISIRTCNLHVHQMCLISLVTRTLITPNPSPHPTI